MSEQLAAALKELALQSGVRRIVTVDGERFEVRRVDAAIVDEGPMIDLPFDPFRSPKARTLIAKLGPRQWPDPIEITDENLAPG